MKPYWTAFKLSIIREMAYRFNFAIDFAFDIIGFLVVVVLWKYIFSQTSAIGGFEYPELITYYFLILILGTLAARNVSQQMMELVNNGRLSMLVVRPLHAPVFLMTLQLSVTLMRFVIYVLMAIGIMIFSDSLILPSSTLGFIIFSFSLVLLFLLNWFFYFLFGCLSFWMTRYGGLLWVVRDLVAFLSGVYFPLSFFSDNIESLLRLSPFYYMRNFQAMLYLERVDFAGVVSGFSLQILWIAILLFLAAKCWKKGMRRYESVGI